MSLPNELRLSVLLLTKKNLAQQREFLFGFANELPNLFPFFVTGICKYIHANVYRYQRVKVYALLSLNQEMETVEFIF